MYISAINNICCANQKYSQQHFTGLIKDRSAVPIIKNMSPKDTSELKKIEKKLSKTKFWDMKISSVGNTYEELKLPFL